MLCTIWTDILCTCCIYCATSEKSHYNRVYSSHQNLRQEEKDHKILTGELASMFSKTFQHATKYEFMCISSMAVKQHATTIQRHKMNKNHFKNQENNRYTNNNKNCKAMLGNNQGLSSSTTQGKEEDLMIMIVMEQFIRTDTTHMKH